MKVLNSSSASEMIGEFLKAELHSSRYREGTLKALKMLGHNEDLLQNPNYANADQNQKRAQVLGLTRGWPSEWLFTDFPKNTQWHLINMSQAELGRCYRLKSRPDMAEPERLVSATAQTLHEGKIVKNVDSELIRQMVKKIKQHESLPPIILVSQTLDGRKVLIEGHSRSIAYCSVPEKYLKNGISAILGTSASMTSWAYF